MNFICKPQKNAVGNTLVRNGEATSPCYETRDSVNRWQGDLYSISSFGNGALPAADVPYWMLANRTCQLRVRDGKIKLAQLVFIATLPLDRFLIREKSVPDQIGEILSKRDSCLYLPPSPDNSLSEHVVVDFNLIYTVQLELCPEAAQKIVQLTSPFAEHAFQKFARYYYTVGYDDEGYKTKAYKESLKQYVESKWKN